MQCFLIDETGFTTYLKEEGTLSLYLQQVGYLHLFCFLAFSLSTLFDNYLTSALHLATIPAFLFILYILQTALDRVDLIE